MKEEHLVERNDIYCMPVCSSLRLLLGSHRGLLGKDIDTLVIYTTFAWVSDAHGGKTEFILTSRKIYLLKKLFGYQKQICKELDLLGKPYNECLPSSKRRPCYCHENTCCGWRCNEVHISRESQHDGQPYLNHACSSHFLWNFRYMTTTTENPP